MDPNDAVSRSSRMGYGRFIAMIATSTVLMFCLMYLNTYLISHVFFSETRVYMAILMGAVMAIVMLSFMLGMYSNRIVNVGVFVGAAVIFAASLWLVRSQVTVGDASYMRAMIPHHSIAIMTSSRADISDPRVRKLADEITYAQDKEIAEMRYLIATVGVSGTVDNPENQPPAVPVSIDEALSTAEVAIVDPEFMSGDELSALTADDTMCTFTYTPDSPPVLAVASDGMTLVKLSGDLVRLEAEDIGTVASAPAFVAEGIEMHITAVTNDTPLDTADGPQEADLLLRLDAGLTAGYRGYYGCSTHNGTQS